MCGLGVPGELVVALSSHMAYQSVDGGVKKAVLDHEYANNMQILDLPPTF